MPVSSGSRNEFTILHEFTISLLLSSILFLFLILFLSAFDVVLLQNREDEDEEEEGYLADAARIVQARLSQPQRVGSRWARILPLCFMWPLRLGQLSCAYEMFTAS
jgi:hypothetical protein